MVRREFRLLVVLQRLENEMFRAAVLGAALDASVEGIAQEIRRQAEAVLAALPAEEISWRQVPEEMELRRAEVEVHAAESRVWWRKAVTLHFPFVCWNHEKARVAYRFRCAVGTVGRRAID